MKTWLGRCGIRGDEIMVSVDFTISETKERNDDEFTKDGKQKVRTYFYQGVSDDGIVIKLSIKGPTNIIEQKFIAFPSGSGTDIKMTISTTQTTLTSVMNDAVAKKKGKTQQTLDDLQTELEQAAPTT